MRKTLMAIWLVLALPVPAASQISEIRIADTTGDSGYPSAFRHYPPAPPCCAFAQRCSDATKICFHREIERIGSDPLRHAAACHLDAAGRTQNQPLEGGDR